MLRRARSRGKGAAGDDPCRIALAVLVIAALASGCGSRAAPRAAAGRATTTTTISTHSTTTTMSARSTSDHSTPRLRRVRHRTYAGPVTAIGDSVMLDAAPVLQRTVPAIDIDASTDRAVETGITALEEKVAQGDLRGPIVFHLGNNSSFRRSQVEHVLQVAAGRRVVLVTDHCSYCSWVPANNLIIHAYCKAANRCFIADWQSLANAHPAWFGSDGVHMPIGGAGARAYTQLVIDAFYAR
jgi:hypothetical protein